MKRAGLICWILLWLTVLITVAILAAIHGTGKHQKGASNDIPVIPAVLS